MMIDPSLFAELKELCMHSFPERLGQRLSQIEPLAAERHPMLALTLSWREGYRLRVENLILRRYADAWTWWSFYDHQKAQREWAVMRWLYAQGLPVPELYALGSESSVPFLLMTRAGGRPYALLLEEEAAKDEGQATLNPCIDALAALLAQLHQSTSPSSVREILPQVTVSEELTRLAEIARQCDDVALIEAAEELIAEEVEVYPPCVLHGDPQLTNLLYDARGVTAWLDWENSALGDPRWDVACVMNWLRGHRTDALAERFCGIYADRLGQPLSDMPFWETLTAVHRWAVVSWVQANASTEEAVSDSRSSPPLPRAEAMTTQIGRYRDQAWRALIRLRHERRERSALSLQSPVDRRQNG